MPSFLLKLVDEWSFASVMVRVSILWLVFVAILVSAFLITEIGFLHFVILIVALTLVMLVGFALAVVIEWLA